MFFTVLNPEHRPEKVLKTEIYLNAYFLIKNYPFKSTETRLDLYLKQNYKISLKDACLQLLLNATISKTRSGDFILLFNNPKDDKLAQLITYGNGLVSGSKILTIVLNQNKENA